jgi:hypothetical protein
MEWMLQVADEIDDAIGALRHCCIGAAAEFPALSAGTVALSAVGGFGAALLAGADPALIAAPAAALGIAGLLKVRHMRLLTSQ